MTVTKTYKTRGGHERKKEGHIGEWKYQEGKARREANRRRRKGTNKVINKFGKKRQGSFIK